MCDTMHVDSVKGAVARIECCPTDATESERSPASSLNGAESTMATSGVVLAIASAATVDAGAGCSRTRGGDHRDDPNSKAPHWRVRTAPIDAHERAQERNAQCAKERGLRGGEHLDALRA